MDSALQIDGLSLSISGHMILDSISFSLGKGSFAALCGLNGAGKSQLLRCIKGLRKIESGRILLNGREADGKERMRRIALVFQDAAMQVVGQTVEKDIAFGPVNMGLQEDEVRERTRKAIDLMGLDGKERRRPQSLSGGELRKCAIAGILAMEPEVILLDEPFANLDYPSTLSVIQALLRLHSEGYTIITVTHEAERFLAHTDTLLIMEGGRMAVQGRSRDVYRTLPDHGIYLPADTAFEDLTWLRQ